MMQIEFNFNNFARVCHSLAACQRHTPSSLAAVIGLSNNDGICHVSYVPYVSYVACLAANPALCGNVSFM